MTERRVMIFYSSRTEPDILDFYAEGLTYLKQSDIESEIIDVSEDPEMAREHDVTATPFLITEYEGETYRHFGIVAGLQEILEEDLYGRSILHRLSFREGRDAATDIDPAADDVSDQVAAAAMDILADHGVEAATVDDIDRDRSVATLTVTIEEGPAADSARIADDIGPFLGGMFTELFATGVRAAVSDVNDREYTFSVAPPETERKQLLGEIRDRLKDAFD